MPPFLKGGVDPGALPPPDVLGADPLDRGPPIRTEKITKPIENAGRPPRPPGGPGLQRRQRSIALVYA
jgi:hypothetical protein